MRAISDTINAAGLALIKRFEGLRLTAYRDSAGVWTIGYGHTGKVDGKSVAKGMTITRAKAKELLNTDVKRFWDYTGLTSCVPVAAALNDNQRSALTSFAFNCGQNSLKTLCKDRTTAEIGEALLLYNKAGGKVLSGLITRRRAERELYLTEVTHDMDTLQKGDKGQQVTVLQILLNHALGCGLDTDGIFGANTQTAVEDYQESKGLTVDGIVGPDTWGALLEE